MDCAKTREYLHSYIDDALSAKTRREMEQHLLACADCAAELAALRSLSYSLRALPQQELPPGFSVALHEKLAAEAAPPRPSLWQSGWARGLAAAACLVLFIGALAAGGNALLGRTGYKNDSGEIVYSYKVSGTTTAPAAPQSSPMPMMEMADPGYFSAADSMMSRISGEAGYGGEYIMHDMAMDDMLMAEEVDMDMPEKPTRSSEYAEITMSAAPAESDGEKQMERKIIRDASLSLKVEDFSAAYQRLNDMAEHYGGYVVSSDAYSYDGEIMQRGYISLRVDAHRLDEALAEIEGMGKVENRTVNTQDITMAYYDIDGRLKQYRTQEQRLMDILRQAETVEDLISLESELTRVRAELESLTGQLRYYDQMTTLSCINVSLYQPDADTQTVRLNGWAGFAQD
ncbi:MAG: DUF4349 domain-containing protein, partial [Clostridiales bacterium]|nr:DUF4349 domain-containing protein [Clostridiales bacterium]